MQTSSAARIAALTTLMAIVPVAGVTHARIQRPQLDELVNAADCIVIGQVKSVRATTRTCLQWIFGSVLLLASATVARLSRRMRSNGAGYIAAAGLFVIAIFVLVGPVGTHRQIAIVFRLTTVKGEASTSTMRLYFDDGFLCEETHFVDRQLYVLFLQTSNDRYYQCWPGWSAWTIDDGYVQTDRRRGYGLEPIALSDFLSRIDSILQQSLNKQPGE